MYQDPKVRVSSFHNRIPLRTEQTYQYTKKNNVQFFMLARYYYTLDTYAICMVFVSEIRFTFQKDNDVL